MDLEEAYKKIMSVQDDCIEGFKVKNARIKELEEIVSSMEEDVRYLNALRAADIV